MERLELRGGPFDGDRGEWTDSGEPPPMIYAHACENPLCPMAGVHWSTEQTTLNDEMYSRTDERANDHRLYVWKQLPSGGQNYLTTEKREPVLV